MSEEVRIVLSVEQVKAIQKTFRIKSSSEELLTKLFLSITEEIDERIDDAWDRIYELADEEVTRTTHRCRACYITQSLVFTPLDEI